MNPGWFTDPDDSSVQRYWDGYQWTSETRPGPNRSRFAISGRQRAIAAAAVVGIAALAGGGAWWADQRSQHERWSLFPHAMGCTLNRDNSSPFPPQPFLQPERVDLEHLDADRMRLAVTFAARPRPIPREIQLPDGTTRSAPGSATYNFTVSTPELLDRPILEREGVLITSPPAPGLEWMGSKLTTNSNMTDADAGLLPVTVSTSDRTISIVLDFADHDQVIKRTPFKPIVNVSTSVDAVQPGKLQYVGNFECGWDTEIAQADDRSTYEPPSAPTPPVLAPSNPQRENGFPPGSKPCPPKYGATGPYTRSAVGNDQTSCPFAEEVRISYADMGSPGSVQEIKVFSPVAQQMYEMTCQQAGNLIVCTGGNDAVVYLN